MILTHGSNSVGSGGGNFPFIGDKNNEWIFSQNDPNLFIDKINGVAATQHSSGGFGPNGYINVNIDHGVNLRVNIEEHDYIELTCIISNEVYDPGQHIRLLTKGRGDSISDSSALLIWRGGYYYWTYYMSGWGGEISNDMYLFSGKKLGVYLKDTTKIDIYIDDVLTFSDVPCPWTTNPSDEYWAVGTEVSFFAQSTMTELERVTIYKNCIPK